MENKELVNTLWQDTLDQIQTVKPAYSVLFLGTKVSYNDIANVLTIEFSEGNDFAFSSVLKHKDVQDILQQAIDHAFGSSATYELKKAGSENIFANESESNDVDYINNDTEEEPDLITVEETESLPCVVPLFAKRFNDLFTHADTDKKKFMRQTGLSERVFSEMTKGTRDTFTLKTLRRACGGLNCSDYELISGTEFQDLLPFNGAVGTNRQKMSQADQAPTKTLDRILMENELYLHNEPNQSPERFVLYPYMTSDISEMKPIDQVKLIVALVNYGGYGVDTDFPYPFSAKFNQYKRSIVNYKRKFEEESSRKQQQARPW